MRIFGLIGKSLGHSLSKDYFRKKFEAENITDCSYELFELEQPESLREWILRNKSIAGLNVTVPYKISIVPYLDELKPPADKIQAVNCIVIQRRGKDLKLIGYNTDAEAFSKTLERCEEDVIPGALVLGDGGAARAVCYALSEKGIGSRQVSRRKTENMLTYSDVNDEIIAAHPLIINATPLGMSPEINSYPQIPYDKLTNRHLLYDLVYNPEETLFLKYGRENGARTKNGLEMLHQQAELSWLNWNG
jgi:shikimate dehydrogenase